jgi:hypothetical protein
MKKIIWLIFTLFLLFSMAAVFGQDQKVVSTQKDETTLKSTDQTPKKVSEMRKVTVRGKQQQTKPKAPVYREGSSSAPVSATRQNTNVNPNKKASTATKEAQTDKKQKRPVIPKKAMK